MSYRNKGLLAAVPVVFGKENHSHYVMRLIENLMGEASKLGIRHNASKELMQDMFNGVAYAITAAEYESAIADLRSITYKRELAPWVEEYKL